MGEFTHFNHNGDAIMVDVSEKDITERTAVATGKIFLCEEAFLKVIDGRIKKGDVLSIARIAGIMASKKTSELIPLCHNIMINKSTIDFELEPKENSITVIATVKTNSRTGVEMEALTSVNVALLTIYDMCKAIDKGMLMKDIHLVSKTGGKSKDFLYEDSYGNV